VLGGDVVAVAALVVLVVGTCRWVSDVLHRYSHHSCTLTFAGDVVCPSSEQPSESTRNMCRSTHLCGSRVGHDSLLG
jgi:hypothetical protein